MAPSHCSRWEGIYDLKKHYLFLKAPGDANGGLHVSISYASKMAHKMATSVLGSLVITSDFPLFKSPSRNLRSSFTICY